VDLGAGLDDVEKEKFLTLKELEIRPLGRPARSHSLFQLLYHGSYDRPVALTINQVRRKGKIL
jgi:hypothetical protein